MGRRSATLQECDNPTCQTETEYVRGEKLPHGYYFDKVTESHEWGGGSLPKMYACSYECIVPALKFNQEYLGNY